MTYTYTLMDVPQSVYGFIRSFLCEAGYDHAFSDGGDGHEHIDMQGIGLRSNPEMPDPQPADAAGSVWLMDVSRTTTASALHNTRERWTALWTGIGQKPPPLMVVGEDTHIWELKDTGGVFVIGMPDQAPLEYMDRTLATFKHVWKEHTGADVHVIMKHNSIGLEHLSDVELHHLGLQRIPK